MGRSRQTLLKLIRGDGSARADLAAGIATLRSRPSVLSAGVASMATWWGTTVVLILAGSAAETLAEAVVIASGNARPGFLGASAPRATLELLQVVVLLVVAVVALELLWFALALPTQAVTVRVLRRGESWREALATVAGRPGRILVGGAVYRTGVVALLPVTAASAVAVYFSLGTPIEALASALGADLHWAVAPAAVVCALVAGRRGAVAAMGSPIAGLAVPDRPGPGVADHDPSPVSVVARAARAALSTPRRTLLGGALTGTLVYIPLVVGVAGLFALDSLSRANGGGLVGLVAVVTVASVFGVVSHALAVVVGIRRGTRSVPDSTGAAGNDPGEHGDADPTDAGSDSPGFREGVPIRRIALALLVLTAGGLAGGVVRVADLRPVEDPAAVPGTVGPGADPDRAVERGLRAVPRSSRVTTLRGESRRVYPNGTAGNWSRTIDMRARFDRRERRTLLTAQFGAENNDWVQLTYVEETVLVSGPVEATGLDPPKAAVRRADLTALPIHPGILSGTGRPSETFGLDGATGGDGWTVVNRTDRRVRFASRDPETVAALSTADVDPEALVDGVARVTLSVETGRVRRIDARYRFDVEGEPYASEQRTTIVVDGYGTTDVDRPPGVERGPVELLLDAVFY